MIYDYWCPRCGKHLDVIKPVSAIDNEEICEKCSLAMVRVIHAVLGNVSNFPGGYNPAFGKTLLSKRDLKNAVVEHEYKTGQRLEEVGTDKMQSVKFKRKEY